jgi:hypothetical protein
MEFLVPTSYLLPPSEADIVVIQRPSTQMQTSQAFPQAQGFNNNQSTAPPGASVPNVPPPSYSGFQQQQQQSHQHRQPQSRGGSALDSNSSEPLIIPDYSQSARSYSSDDQQPQQESLLNRADAFFKGIFGGQAQPPPQPPPQPQRRASAPPFMQAPEPYVPIDESTVQQLMEMGFSREAVTQALTANRGKNLSLCPLLCFRDIDFFPISNYYYYNRQFGASPKRSVNVR